MRRDALQKFRRERIGDSHPRNDLAVLHILGNEKLASRPQRRGDQQSVPPGKPRLVLHRPGLDGCLRVKRRYAPRNEIGQIRARRRLIDKLTAPGQHPIAFIQVLRAQGQRMVRYRPPQQIR